MLFLNIDVFHVLGSIPGARLVPKSSKFKNYCLESELDTPHSRPLVKNGVCTYFGVVVLAEQRQN